MGPISARPWRDRELCYTGSTLEPSPPSGQGMCQAKVLLQRRPSAKSCPRDHTCRRTHQKYQQNPPEPPPPAPGASQTRLSRHARKSRPADPGGEGELGPPGSGERQPPGLNSKCFLVGLPACCRRAFGRNPHPLRRFFQKPILGVQTASPSRDPSEKVGGASAP